MTSDETMALAFLEEQIRLVEEASDEQNEMAGLHTTPSEGQGYLLVTDKYGRAQLDQDSAFVASRIQFLGVLPSTSFPVASQLGVSIRDAGASIMLTISRWKQGLSTGGTVPVSNDVAESQFSCVAALVPQSRDPNLSTGQVDYVYTLSARLIIPRASTIRVAFAESPGNGVSNAGAAIQQYHPQVLLVGRKVYG